MRIEKGNTAHFSQYEVYAKILKNLPQSFWQWIRRYQPTVEVEVKLEGVIEADDESGLVVQHMVTEQGHPVYTNGVDEIFIDNSATLLLLVPSIRQAFLLSRFVPKLSRTYNPNLIIKYKGPVQPDVIIKQIVNTETSPAEV